MKHTSILHILLKTRGLDIIESIFQSMTLEGLISNIEIYSEQYNEYSYPDKNKFKGDLFEIFIEAFIQILGPSQPLLLSNYEPYDPTKDYGVDGTCLNNYGEKTTVQVKFRTDINYSLKQEDIGGFVGSSYANDLIDQKSKGKVLYIFTTAKALNFAIANEMYAKKIEVINFDTIRKLVNNNKPFWDSITEKYLTYREALYNL